jgi:hypothetical protein
MALDWMKHGKLSEPVQGRKIFLETMGRKKQKQHTQQGTKEVTLRKLRDNYMKSRAITRQQNYHDTQ